AAEWVKEVWFEDLDPRQAEIYRRVQLKILVAAEDRAGALAQARSMLLGTMPPDFHSLKAVSRVEALEVIVAAGGMEEYQGFLRDLIDLAPDSPSLHLLLGESADFLWKGAPGETGEDVFKEEAVQSYSRAVALRPDLVEFRMELCDWLGGRELWEEAVIHYRHVLEKDPLSALLIGKSLFEPFRRTGRLSFLVDFLEKWEAPEAASMDEFY